MLRVTSVGAVNSLISVMVADRRAAVEHAGALRLGIFEQVRGIDVFHVERRILAHDHRAEFRQRQIPGGRLAPPVVAVQIGVRDQFDGGGRGLDRARLDIEIALHGHA
jgi:hypothetical protein